jgi:hypothetical protein
MNRPSHWTLAVWAIVILSGFVLGAAETKIVLLAGGSSHGGGDHEHRAGCLLLQQCLNQVPGVRAEVYTNGWPPSAATFTGAAAIVIYADGGDGHPFLRDARLKDLAPLMRNGVGLGCLHYAVEVPKDRGGSLFLDWIGGYFETFWSVNPSWEADFKKLPQHPITRGVDPFKIYDEWYYHMRFRENMQGVTPILTAIPPDATRRGGDDPHGGNRFVRERIGLPEHLMWASERANGGRGFGFTGGHFHKNWGNSNFRKLVLNAILWIAKVDVPANGLACDLSPQDLEKNLDPK